MDEWFVCVPGGAPIGPVSTSLLILGIRSGKVPDDALVCRRGEKTWRGVMEAPELAAALPGPNAFKGAAAEARYAVKTMLGQGGMGEVYLCADEWIGREVAMKVAHRGKAAEAHLRARFVREALVQGQLEHPSVVPVYDLGTRPDGATYFTMKRVRGLTLAAIIEGLRRGDAAVSRAYSRRRLLTAMSSVCLAVSFAHSRGVVHRDLKPENVMLGDFGEVYVLDWGVARVLEDAWAHGKTTIQGAAPLGRTQAGAIVGTPGYAAPEQVEGDRRVGEAADIYALGAILFELLALAPLHSGRSIDALIASTLTSSGGRPGDVARHLSIPPELDRICARATALAPGDRFATTREMQEAIESYLDGERDAERRRDLARQHADRAAEAFATAANAGVAGEAERARGLRELGAALALEPSNEDALRTLVRVVFESSDELSPEAEQELRVHQGRDRVRGARDAMLSYFFMAVGAPILLSMPIRRPLLFAALVASVVAATTYNLWMWRAEKAGPRQMARLLPLAFLVVGLTSGLFGPFILVPGTAAVTVASLLVNLRANLAARRATLGLGLAAVLVPMALQQAGLSPPSYVFEPGSDPHPLEPRGVPPPPCVSHARHRLGDDDRRDRLRRRKRRRHAREVRAPQLRAGMAPEADAPAHAEQDRSVDLGSAGGVHGLPQLPLGLPLRPDPPDDARPVADEGHRQRAHAEAARQDVAGVVNDGESDTEALDDYARSVDALVLVYAHERDLGVRLVHALGRGERLLAGGAVVGEKLHDDRLAGETRAFERLSVERPAMVERRQGLAQEGVGGGGGVARVAAARRKRPCDPDEQSERHPSRVGASHGLYSPAGDCAAIGEMRTSARASTIIQIPGTSPSRPTGSVTSPAAQRSLPAPPHPTAVRAVPVTAASPANVVTMMPPSSSASRRGRTRTSTRSSLACVRKSGISTCSVRFQNPGSYLSA